MDAAAAAHPKVIVSVDRMQRMGNEMRTLSPHVLWYLVRAEFQCVLILYIVCYT